MGFGKAMKTFEHSFSPPLAVLLCFLFGCGSVACGGGTPTDSLSADSNSGSGGGASNPTGGSGTAGTPGAAGSLGMSPIDSPVCDAPQAWDVPAEEHVVGDGSAASCTEATLSTAIAAGGSIRFSCGSDAVTIPITLPLEVKKPTVIDGASKITLNGGKKNRILVVASGSTLSVRNLRFVGGKTASTMEPEGIGGAVAGNWRSKVEVRGCIFEDNEAARGGGAVSVWTGSELTIVSSVFLKNRSWYGGAVYSLLSPITIVDSEFRENVANTEEGMGDGGAIGTDGASESPDDELGGTVAICGSLLEENSGAGSGGGAYIWVYPPDKVVIDRTTVASNSIAENDGGGSLGGGMRISNGAITIENSTFASNQSIGNGGALYLDCAPTCLLRNTTLFGNHSEAYGGAIFGDGPSLENVTLAENYAGGHGGALFGGHFKLKNTLFVDNDSGNPWGQARNCSDTFMGENVLQWRSDTSDAGGDTCIDTLISADPKLSKLSDHGGPTPTLLPGEGSGALNKGSSCPATDQRGEARPANACELGSIEVP